MSLVVLIKNCEEFHFIFIVNKIEKKKKIVILIQFYYWNNGHIPQAAINLTDFVSLPTLH